MAAKHESWLYRGDAISSYFDYWHDYFKKFLQENWECMVGRIGKYSYIYHNYLRKYSNIVSLHSWLNERSFASMN